MFTVSLSLMLRIRIAFAAALVLWLTGCAPQAPSDWQTALEAFVNHEMAQKSVPSVSITVVEGAEFTWSREFGTNTDLDSTPTVHRVASVSKLFTAMAVMQLAEMGTLDIDAPVTDYLPDFLPHNPFGGPITLRQLLSHRSGLVREPPVGHYFDDTAPTLQATVKSLDRTSLVLAPEAATKYSNAAVAVAGYVVEEVTGTPFEAYVQASILDPLGMTSTSFSPREDLQDRLATGYMWRYDTASLTEAPVFELGIGPAGNLYSTTADLGRFARALMAISRDEYPEVLSAASLHQMWTPQFAESGTDEGYGLGFHVSQHEGHTLVGHAGAIYGYATRVWALPGQDLGIAVASTVDISNAVVDRIARAALSMILAANSGEPLPEPPRTTPVDSAAARAAAGTYASGDKTLTLIERNGSLLLDTGALRYDVRMLGNEFVADGRLGIGHVRFTMHDDALVMHDGAQYRKLSTARPPQVPEAVKDVIGEYGWDHNVLYVYEDAGALHVLIEWFFRYALEPVAADVYRFPEEGLYMHETLTFLRNADGLVTEANLAGVSFMRRDAGPDEGDTFRIVPQKPIDVLRRDAAAAQPPAEDGSFKAPDLVDLTALDADIRLDVRYATSNNFMGAPFYRSPRAFLQRPAAEALAHAAEVLAARGYGMVIYDGYRPWRVTKMFWDATPDSLRLFVANPSRGSRHNRGCAIDLGLYDLATGAVEEMPSGYDEFTARAFPDYPGGTALSRYHRELLRTTMEDAGFTVYEAEWWHYDYKDWRSYPIINKTFEELD